MRDATNQKLAEILRDPAAHFDSPQDVLASTSLGDDDKLAVLKSMLQELRLLDAAAEENMPGPKPYSLSDVNDALTQLCDDMGIEKPKANAKV